MKRILLFLMLSAGVFAQNKGRVEKNVDQLLAAGTVFQTQNLIANHANDTRNTAQVSDATVLNVNFGTVQSLLTAQPEFIRISLPYQNQILNINLYKVAIKSADFEVLTPQGSFANFLQSAHYRGTVSGLNRSLVSLNIYPNQINGIIATETFGNLNLGKLKNNTSAFSHILYSDVNLKKSNEFNCAVKEKPTELTAETSAVATTSRCVTNYYEIDHAIYLENNSSEAETTAWMESLFNNVQTIFDNDEVNTALKSIFIWTTPDSYSGETSVDYLFGFNTFRPTFNGDVGMLLGIDEGALGGVAATINGLCNEQNFSYSDVDLFFEDLPLYSWPVNVVTHELGHLFGSQHTHGCYWNGNDTPIDGCGTTFSEFFAEGDCEFGSLPEPGVGGTIMSYCHILPEIGVNLINGFGPQPAARMQTAINNSSCLSTDCINTCITLVSNLVVNNVTDSSASFTWNDEIPETSYEISAGIYPFPVDQMNFIPLTGQQAAIGSLIPNTFYRFFVRPDCPENVTGSAASVLFATAANWCESPIVITDTGGSIGEYQDNERWVRQIIPTTFDSAIKINFTEFFLEQDYDFLTIYNGIYPGPDATLVGQFTGIEVPEMITSTAANGALTLEFYSDGFISDLGFTAEVSCLTLGVSENQYIDLQYYPNPTTDILTVRASIDIQKIEIYSMDGRKVIDQQNSGSMLQVNTAALAQGSYIAKIIGTDVQTNFKFVKR